jgi:hypothetical protein
VVPNRALAYAFSAGGWIQDTPIENIIGAGGMLSTVGDWLLWNDNFTQAKVGGPEIVKMQQTPATLSGGKTIPPRVSQTAVRIRGWSGSSGNRLLTSFWRTGSGLPGRILRATHSIASKPDGARTPLSTKANGRFPVL